MSTNKKDPSQKRGRTAKPPVYDNFDAIRPTLEANLRLIIGKDNKEDLADEIGISRPTILGYIPSLNSEEKAEAKAPSLRALYNLAEKYNVSMDWLCGRTGSVKSLDPDTQVVNRITGLSEEAIQNLIQVKAPPPQIDVNTGTIAPADIQKRPALAVLRSQSAYADVRDNYGMEAYFRALDDLLASEYLREFVAALDSYFYNLERNDIPETVLSVLDKIKNSLNEKYGLLDGAGRQYKEMTSKHFTRMYREMASSLNTGEKTKQDLAGYAIFLNKMEAYLRQTYTPEEISGMKGATDFSRLDALKPDYEKMARNSNPKFTSKKQKTSKKVSEPGGAKNEANQKD